MTPMIFDHPLIQHKISLLRNKNTGSKEFRELVGEVSMLMCYEATRDLPLKEVEIETPVALAKTKVIAGRKLAFVPILRAGICMLDGVLSMVPAAKVGHIGLYRDPMSARSLSSTQCWQPAVLLSLPSRCSRKAALPISNSCASSQLQKV